MNIQNQPPPINVEKQLKPCPRNLVLGNFNCIAHLGSGSFGNVYLAENQQTRERVAIKQITKRLTDRSALQNEIIALTRLGQHCGNIAICFEELFEDEQNYYLVTDYIDGYEVRDVLYELNDMQSTLLLLYNVAYALYLIHYLGIAHNDVQAYNILVMPDGDVRFIDFGLACLQNCSPRGTLNYISPEKLHRLISMTEGTLMEAQQSDVYAVGVIFYMSLFKEFPRKHVKDRRSLISWSQALQDFQHVKSEIDEKGDPMRKDLIEIIMNCIDHNVLRRYTSKQLLAHIESVIEKYGIKEEM